jgi:hypothetical protein
MAHSRRKKANRLVLQIVLSMEGRSIVKSAKGSGKHGMRHRRVQLCR